MRTGAPRDSVAGSADSSATHCAAICALACSCAASACSRISFRIASRASSLNCISAALARGQAGGRTGSCSDAAWPQKMVSRRTVRMATSPSRNSQGGGRRRPRAVLARLARRARNPLRRICARNGAVVTAGAPARHYRARHYRSCTPLCEDFCTATVRRPSAHGAHGGSRRWRLPTATIAVPHASTSGEWTAVGTAAWRCTNLLQFRFAEQQARHRPMAAVRDDGAADAGLRAAGRL